MRRALKVFACWWLTEVALGAVEGWRHPHKERTS